MTVTISLRCDDDACTATLPTASETVIGARTEARVKDWTATRQFISAAREWKTTDQCPAHRRARQNNSPPVITERLPASRCSRADACPGHGREEDIAAVYDWCGHDALGHRMANILLRHGYNTVDKVTEGPGHALLDLPAFGTLCFRRWQHLTEVPREA